MAAIVQIQIANTLTRILAEFEDQASDANDPDRMFAPRQLTVTDRGHRITHVRKVVLERLKRTIIVWLAVYPSVLLVVSLTADWMQDWQLPHRVLGATIIIVPIVTNITEPAVRTAVGKIEEALLQRRTNARP